MTVRVGAVTVRGAGILRVVVAVSLTAGLTACGSAIEGTAVREGAGSPRSQEFASLLTECDAVTNEQIAQTVGGDAIERGFFGAICRWDVSAPGGIVKVTFNWFETGTMDVERTTADRLGYTVEDTTVEGRRAILVRQPADPGACGVTAGAPDAGIIGWWVQYQPGSAHPDPCEAVLTLAKLTLNLSR